MGSLYSYLKDDFINMSTIIHRLPGLNFRREEDYSPLGWARPSARSFWLKQMKCMILSELPTRRLLFPVIHERIVHLQVSQKYSATRSKLYELMVEFPEWDEERFFELHDLFTGFEVGGSYGLIDLKRVVRGFDLLADECDISERILQLTKFSDDVRYIHYQKLLKAVYDLDTVQPKDHPLAKSVERATALLNWNRSMSTIQKFQKGFI